MGCLFYSFLVYWYISSNSCLPHSPTAMAHKWCTFHIMFLSESFSFACFPEWQFIRLWISLSQNPSTLIFTNVDRSYITFNVVIEKKLCDQIAFLFLHRWKFFPFRYLQAFSLLLKLNIFTRLKWSDSSHLIISPRTGWILFGCRFDQIYVLLIHLWLLFPSHLFCFLLQEIIFLNVGFLLSILNVSHIFHLYHILGEF